MPDYLLDTNIVKYWYDDTSPQHANVLARVQTVRQPCPLTQYVPRLFISVVTLGEIEYGHRVTLKPDTTKQAEYMAFVREQCPQRLEITSHVAGYYGELKAWLFNNFSDKRKRTRAKRLNELVDPTTGSKLGVEENDIWIAAQAITFNLVLVTNDSRGNFGRLQRHFATMLRLENWVD